MLTRTRARQTRVIVGDYDADGCEVHITQDAAFLIAHALRTLADGSADDAEEDDRRTEAGLLASTFEAIEGGLMRRRVVGSRPMNGGAA
jgi:hypothetical protein